MSKPKKPDPRCGSVQPFKDVSLDDRLIKELQHCLDCSAADMGRATAEVEYRLSMYDAERVSLDQAPSMASIKGEVLPIMSAIYSLIDRLEALTPATLNAISEKRICSRKDTTSVDEGMLFLARFGETFKPVMHAESESRGGSNKKDARRFLIISLADIYQKYAKLPVADKNDFISEILEWRDIDVDDKEIAKHI